MTPSTDGSPRTGFASLSPGSSPMLFTSAVIPTSKAPEPCGIFTTPRNYSLYLVAEPEARDGYFEEIKQTAWRFVSDPLRWRQITAVARRLAQLGELNRPQTRADHGRGRRCRRSQRDRLRVTDRIDTPASEAFPDIGTRPGHALPEKLGDGCEVAPDSVKGLHANAFGSRRRVEPLIGRTLSPETKETIDSRFPGRRSPSVTIRAASPTACGQAVVQ